MIAELSPGYSWMGDRLWYEVPYMLILKTNVSEIQPVWTGLLLDTHPAWV